MNDKELRKLAEAVIDPENDFDPYSTAYEDFTVAANPKAVIELLDRLEALTNNGRLGEQRCM